MSLNDKNNISSLSLSFVTVNEFDWMH